MIPVVTFFKCGFYFDGPGNFETISSWAFKRWGDTIRAEGILIHGGKTVWVQPCMVGDKNKGMVHKDYKVSH